MNVRHENSGRRDVLEISSEEVFDISRREDRLLGRALGCLSGCETGDIELSIVVYKVERIALLIFSHLYNIKMAILLAKVFLTFCYLYQLT